MPKSAVLHGDAFSATFWAVLLTLRAVRALQAADVILFDALVLRGVSGINAAQGAAARSICR